jgi:ABC-type transport system substrate-binding protein
VRAILTALTAILLLLPCSIYAQSVKIVPQLATGYEWAADRKSIVIKLRPGVRFQDGEPFRAWT